MPQYTPDSSLPELQWKEPRGPWHVRKSFTVIREGIKVRVFKGESTRTKNKAEARKKALELLAKWGANVEKSLVIELFRDASQAYEDSRQNESEDTKNSIKYSRKHLDPYFGARRLESITLNTWTDYVAARLKESPGAALFNEWKTFTGTMNLMHSQGNRSLKLKVKNPDEDRERKKIILTEAELERMFLAANPKTQLQMALSLDLFLRPPKESCGLRWDENVDLTPRPLPDGRKIWGVITIWKGDTKTREFRVVPMTESIWKALVDHKARQAKRNRRDYGKVSPYVFHAHGDPDKPVSDYRTAFKRVLKRADVTKPATPYALRRTGLTIAYRRAKTNAGMEGTKDIPMSAVKIAIVAGHSIETAMKEYLNLDASDLSDVQSLVEFGGKYLGKTYVGTSGKVRLTESN